MSTPPRAAVSTYTLPAYQELRLDCTKPNEDVYLKLLEGSAEVTGAELIVGQRVRLTGKKLAVYTWSGAKVELEGRPEFVYDVTDQQHMPSYLNVHQNLNVVRESAKQSSTHGPRCVVLGQVDTGKSTICKMLINWAVRSGWEPTFVELDVGQGSITVPGCIGAVPIENPVDVEEGYPLDMPLVYYYGYDNADAERANPDLYKRLISNLAAVLERRNDQNKHAAASGMVVNTMGWVEGPGYDLQMHVVSALKADVVLVLESDALFARVTNDLKHSSPDTKVVKLSKSGGVQPRSREQRREAREQRVREYFYGPNLNFQPETRTIPLDSFPCKFLKIGFGSRPWARLQQCIERQLLHPLTANQLPCLKCQTLSLTSSHCLLALWCVNL